MLNTIKGNMKDRQDRQTMLAAGIAASTLPTPFLLTLRKARRLKDAMRLGGN